MSLVDIICSVRNGGSRLEATLCSVLNQTFTNFMFVVIDDGSNDGITATILERYRLADPRVVVRRNPSSLGLTANLVAEVAASRAPYIGRIDSGDTWRPDKLRRQIEYLERHPHTIMVGCQTAYVDATGRALGQSWFAERDEKIRRQMLLGDGVFSHSTIVFRRQLNYRPEFKYSQDLDLYLRASRLGELTCISDVLADTLHDVDGISLKRKAAQLSFQKLAYRSHRRVTSGKPDIPLAVRPNPWGEWGWRLATPFFRRYVELRVRGGNAVFYGVMLAVTCVLYPPLGLQYFRRALWRLHERR